MKELKDSCDVAIRFSEVDSMQIVWHGSYPLYLEDAREHFGRKYGIGYAVFADNGYGAPVVELSIKYKRMIRYGTAVKVDIFYIPEKSAKLSFNYEIRSVEDNSLLATARTVQVFIDKDEKLCLYAPEFYQEWRKKWNVML